MLYTFVIRLPIVKDEAVGHWGSMIYRGWNPTLRIADSLYNVNLQNADMNLYPILKPRIKHHAAPLISRQLRAAGSVRHEVSVLIRIVLARSRSCRNPGSVCLIDYQPTPWPMLRQTHRSGAFNMSKPPGLPERLPLAIRSL